MFVLSSEHKDIYFKLFMRQGKLSGWRNIYESEKNHNILQDRLNGFPLREPYISCLRQVCAMSVYMCTLCLSEGLGMSYSCVCVHGCVKDKGEREIWRQPSPSVFCITVVGSHYPSWALWEFHQSVTSHLFTHLSGLYHVEKPRVPPDTALTLHILYSFLPSDIMALWEAHGT